MLMRELMAEAVEGKASDLHITVVVPPIVRSTVRLCRWKSQY